MQFHGTIIQSQTSIQSLNEIQFAIRGVTYNLDNPLGAISLKFDTEAL